MTDPLGARPRRPAPNGLLLKAAVVIPDVLISSLLWLVLIAALPVTVGFVVTVVGVALGALLAAGPGEDAVVRVLYRARRATPLEAPRLTVAWRLANHHTDADGVRLRIASSGAPVARGLAYAIGRRLAWIPLVQFAWRTRIVVGTIAIVLEAQAGRWPSPVVIAGFIALSYLMPYCRGAWERRLCGASDDRNADDIAMVGHPLPRAEGRVR